MRSWLSRFLFPVFQLHQPKQLFPTKIKLFFLDFYEAECKLSALLFTSSPIALKAEPTSFDVLGPLLEK